MPDSPTKGPLLAFDGELMGSQQGITYGVEYDRRRQFILSGGTGAAVYPADAFDGPGPVKRPYYPEHLPLVAAGITEPDYMWTMQEPSGSFLFDLCNNPAGLLSGSLNVSYGQAVTGWTSSFVGITAEAGNSGFLAPISTLWNIGGQSIFTLQYSAALVSGGSRCLFLGGGNGGLQIQILTAGQATCFCSSQTVGSFVYENVTPTVYPFSYTYDRRVTTKAMVETNREAITGSWANLSDNAKGLGSNAVASPTARHNLFLVWVGSNAEAMIDRGGGKQLIRDLGWTMFY